MMTIESEEFYNLMQAYRHMSVLKQQETCDAYQAVIDHVDAEIAALREKLEHIEKVAQRELDNVNILPMYPPQSSAARNILLAIQQSKDSAQPDTGEK